VSVCAAAISLEGKEFVESGERVMLRCNATDGHRAPDDVDWFKTGDKIEPAKYPHVRIDKYKQDRALISELVIERASKMDSGTYICRSSLEQIASVDVAVLVGKQLDNSHIKINITILVL
jgi:hypothetical protein